MNEKSYIKLKVNPFGVSSQNLEHHINELLNRNYSPRYKYQLSYLAKFSKIVNAEKVVFHNWVKSDFNYNHAQFGTQDSIHNLLLQKLDDEQLELSGFALNGIVNVILEIYQVNDNQASSWVELTEKYRKNESNLNIKYNNQFRFL